VSDHQGTCSGLHFADASTGWLAAGFVIYKTTDGGETWAMTSIPPIGGSMFSDISLADLHFFGAMNGWAVGIQITFNMGPPTFQGIVVRTTDGGANWMPAQSLSGGFQQPNGGQDVHFADASTGWIATQGILKSTDGGATWTKQETTISSVRAVHFLNGLIGWAVGSNGSIIHTTDGGTTWTEQASGNSNSLSGIHFADSLIGFAVGNGGTILATKDGGGS